MNPRVLQPGDTQGRSVRRPTASMYFVFILLVASHPVASESIVQSSGDDAAPIGSAGRKLLRWSDDAWYNAIPIGDIGRDYQIRIGGNVMMDAATGFQGGALEGDAVDGVPNATAELRDLKLDLRGHKASGFQFRVQFDINDQQVQLQDSYLRWEDVPYVGSVQIGHFKEPFGLENSMSAQHLPLMECSLTDALTPSEGIGVAFGDVLRDGRMSWRAGAFFETRSVDSISDSAALSLTGRFTGLPIYRNESHELLHLGLSATLRMPNAPLNFVARPEVNLAPRVLDTGDFYSNQLNILNIEAAYQRGSHLFQWEIGWSTTAGAVREENVTLDDVADSIAETYPRLVEFLQGRTEWDRPEDSYLWEIPFDLNARGELQFFGTYAQWSYVLTKETRPYDMARGVFGPVVPQNPFSFKEFHGLGAWEVAGRISHLDLVDSYVDGGRETNITLGLNWYLNDRVKVMWNYVHGNIDKAGDDDDFDVFQMRIQIGFPPKALNPFGRGTRSESPDK